MFGHKKYEYVVNVGCMSKSLLSNVEINIANCTSLITISTRQPTIFTDCRVFIGQVFFLLAVKATENTLVT